MARPFITIIACSFVTFVLGSIHAYSVFLEPLETRFQVSRDDASLGYSLGLACLTLAVLVGYRIYGLMRPALLVVAICSLAIVGATVATLSESITGFWLGYGIVFGAANGLGYGYCLQLGARAGADRSGMAMGLITASYAAGATVFPVVFDFAIAQGGLRLALVFLIATLGLVAVVSGCLLELAKARYAIGTSRENLEPAGSKGKVIVLWLGYGTGAGAGLMVIAHAYPILIWLQVKPDLALLGTTLFAAGNLVGGLFAGWAGDRLEIRYQIASLPAVSALLFLVMLMQPPLVVLLVAMTVTGFCYGALIVCYPIAVTQYFGSNRAPQVYGRVFTAWGLAGLAGPWFAGFLFEAFNGYEPTLVAAALIGVASCLIVVFRLSPLPANEGR